MAYNISSTELLTNNTNEKGKKEKIKMLVHWFFILVTYCAGLRAEKPPNIVLMVADDLVNVF